MILPELLFYVIDCIFFFMSILQVDIFHLENSYPTTNWKDEYNQNKKVTAWTYSFIDLGALPLR